jgi:hypothetical protein
MSANNPQPAIGHPPFAIRYLPSAIDLVLFAASLLLYTLTLAPSVLSADNGEFQLVAWKLGIAHPPGYPLYTLAGFLFSRWFTSPAYALNLLSAILASITLVLVSRSVRAATGSTLGGLTAAIVLGTSTTFWAQATTANIRMPAALFTALCVYFLVSYHPTTQPPNHPKRNLILFAICFSLGLGHHLSLIFPGVFFIVYMLLIDPALVRQPRRWIRPGIAFLLGLLILLYLPLRGATGGTLADGESTTYLARPDKFLEHVLARGFEGDFFYFVNTRPDLFGDRLALLPTLFNFQFNLGALLLAGLGSILLARRNWRLLVLLLGGIVTHTFVTLAYRAPQTVEYLLPAYVLFAILIGCGIGSIMTKDEGRKTNDGHPAFVSRHLSIVGIALSSLAVITGLAHGLDNLPSFAWLARNEDTRPYAESLLRDAPPNAIILSNWHWANPMWYLQQVEGLRPDVDVIYVFPRGEPLAASWLNTIEDSLAAGRPVVVNMFFREEFAASPFFFEPISREAFQVHKLPMTNRPLSFTTLEANFANQLKLLGYRLLDSRTTPAEPLTLFLAWRVAAQPDRDYSFFAHLVDATGRVIGQSDRTLPAARYRPGDVFVERFFVAPLPDVSPGEYSLVAGIYSVENGQIVQLANRIPVTQASIEPFSQLTNYPASPAIALSHGIYFLGSTASTGGDLHPGERLTLDLRFLATRPLTRDFVVSVQMIGVDHAWKTASDSVPALGAIPTLKWIAGSHIVDRHVIDIPADAPPGPASVSLILYDNFTQQPLALLDAQLVQHGPSIPLGAWNVAAP